MPHFLLAFGDARRPPVGAVIIEAPSLRNHPRPSYSASASRPASVELIALQDPNRGVPTPEEINEAFHGI
jgi:hypothetical protein